MTLTLGISPCPNDTFVFHHLIHRSDDYAVTLADVEVLNQGEHDVTKISVAGYGHLRDRYALLRAGGAAGFGVGPLVVAKNDREVGGRVAIPGERTTAALLLRLLGTFDTIAMPFDAIEDAVLGGEADCGVLIHEGRFTYESKDLVKLHDLGALWEERLRCPVPLGAIAIRREFGPEVARSVDEAIRASAIHAFVYPFESAAFVHEHAQEMDADVQRRHIELYVNDYTLRIEEAAVERLLDFGEEQGLFSPSSEPVFAY